jgi:hypothetical protein
MSCVFQNIDPPPPPRPASVYPPPPLVRAGKAPHSLGGEEGGGVNILEDADTALYSTYVSTLCSWRSNAKPTLNPGYTKYVKKTY